LSKERGYDEGRKKERRQEPVRRRADGRQTRRERGGSDSVIPQRPQHIAQGGVGSAGCWADKPGARPKSGRGGAGGLERQGLQCLRHQIGQGARDGVPPKIGVVKVPMAKTEDSESPILPISVATY
ncbi:hypothetical protein THAOC_09350, partial [Thalassiosira oceanica]